ncbi:ribonucleoprotein PTB-binding 1-like [Branchiostoma lanceolatum]|uniref:ribonucleoprotein PTB-binding 1-like n=1 Tax=Branchiostoma lanceolatum TaxID=7740 RepID=UPI0034517117
MAAAVHSKPPLLGDPQQTGDLNGNSAETMSSEDSQGSSQRGEVVLKPEETLTALGEEEKSEVLWWSKSEFNNRRRIVVRNLPNDVTAQDIQSMLADYGVQHVHLDKATGTAQVTVQNGDQAGTAILKLHHSSYKDRQISVTLAPNDSLLCVSNLPQLYALEQLQELARPFGILERCFLLRSDRTGLSKGYGFVEYTKKESALQAKIQLTGRRIGTRILCCDIMDPGLLTHDSLHSNCLLVEKLPMDFRDTSQLSRIFSQLYPPMFCQISVGPNGQSRGFAVLEYETPEQAEIVHQETNGHPLQDVHLRVAFCPPGHNGPGLMSVMATALSSVSVGPGKNGLLPDPNPAQLLNTPPTQVQLQLLANQLLGLQNPAGKDAATGVRHGQQPVSDMIYCQTCPTLTLTLQEKTQQQVSVMVRVYTNITRYMYTAKPDQPNLNSTGKEAGTGVRHGLLGTTPGLPMGLPGVHPSVMATLITLNQQLNSGRGGPQVGANANPQPNLFQNLPLLNMLLQQQQPGLGSQNPQMNPQVPNGMLCPPQPPAPSQQQIRQGLLGDGPTPLLPGGLNKSSVNAAPPSLSPPGDNKPLDIQATLQALLTALGQQQQNQGGNPNLSALISVLGQLQSSGQLQNSTASQTAQNSTQKNLLLSSAQVNQGQGTDKPALLGQGPGMGVQGGPNAILNLLGQQNQVQSQPSPVGVSAGLVNGSGGQGLNTANNVNNNNNQAIGPQIPPLTQAGGKKKGSLLGDPPSNLKFSNNPYLNLASVLPTRPTMLQPPPGMMDNGTARGNGATAPRIGLLGVAPPGFLPSQNPQSAAPTSEPPAVSASQQPPQQAPLPTSQQEYSQNSHNKNFLLSYFIPAAVLCRHVGTISCLFPPVMKSFFSPSLFQPQSSAATSEPPAVSASQQPPQQAPLPTSQPEYSQNSHSFQQYQQQGYSSYQEQYQTQMQQWYQYQHNDTSQAFNQQSAEPSTEYYQRAYEAYMTNNGFPQEQQQQQQQQPPSAVSPPQTGANMPNNLVQAAQQAYSYLNKFMKKQQEGSVPTATTAQQPQPPPPGTDALMYQQYAAAGFGQQWAGQWAQSQNLDQAALQQSLLGTTPMMQQGLLATPSATQQGLLGASPPGPQGLLSNLPPTMVPPAKHNFQQPQHPVLSRKMTPAQKRKAPHLLPSPEPSPESGYIGQHSQGLGGHYADTYNIKKRRA